MHWLGKTWLFGAQNARNALPLGDGEYPIHCGQLYNLLDPGRPANLGTSGVGRIAEPEVRPLIVRRDIAPAAHHVLSLAKTVGRQIYRGSHRIARALRPTQQLQTFRIEPHEILPRWNYTISPN